MKSQLERFLWPIALPVRHHFFGSIFIVFFVAVIISAQILDRRDFADSELHEDVMDRWGTPIAQPAPSVRFVNAGTVFNDLSSLPLASQRVAITTAMNYRKRGLVYFSGFDFTFDAAYRVVNDRGNDIDAVFVFPLNVEANRVLLSDLTFVVDGKPAPIALENEDRALIWTGRIAAGHEVAIDIGFRGRGLDSFLYRMDPSLPVRDFELTLTVTGGDNHDYAPEVVPATSLESTDGQMRFAWTFASLESGVPVGVVLPSERSYDKIIVTMVSRSWAPFLLLFIGVVATGYYYGKPLRFFEAYLIAACYAFFFVLLAYLAAFMSFLLAYALSLAILGALILWYTRRIIAPNAAPVVLGLLVSSLLLPTGAAILTGYTGLIYSLEILGGLIALAVLTTRGSTRELIERSLATVVEPITSATAPPPSPETTS